jgi:hypothetical protein
LREEYAAMSAHLRPQRDLGPEGKSTTQRVELEKRTGQAAGLAGEELVFEAFGGPENDQVTWLGGGKPATGSGPRFSTVFRTGGSFTVTAHCGNAQVEFPVAICPVDGWLAAAGSFYGVSLDLSRVRVKTSRLVLGPPRTAWTCNNVIRFKRPNTAEELPRESTLIHELAHVWQHQTGQAQLVGGLVDQLGRRLLGRDPYDFGGPAGVRAAERLTDFRKEGQAQIITEYWRWRKGFSADQRGVTFSVAGYPEDLRRLVEEAGIRTQQRGRPRILGRIDGALARLVNAVADRLG